MTKFLPSQSIPSEQIIQPPYMQFLLVLGQTCPESCPWQQCSGNTALHQPRVYVHDVQCCVACTLPREDVTPDSREHLGHCFLLSYTHTHSHTHTHTHTVWLLLEGTRGLIFSHFDVTFYRISIFRFRAACFPTSGCRPGKSFFFPTITNKMPRFYGGRHCHTPARIWSNSGDSGG